MTLALLLAACGGASVEGGAGAAGPVTAARLFPLARGNAWSYDVDNGLEVVLAVSTVVAAEGPRRIVRTGQAEQTYELRPEGIFRGVHGVWLLRDPIADGDEWESAGGRTARITSTSAAADVPAGHFRGCVVVHEQGGEAASIETTYCPDVGPVLVRTELTMDLSGETVTVVGKLRGFAVE